MSAGHNSKIIYDQKRVHRWDRPKFNPYDPNAKLDYDLRRDTWGGAFSGPEYDPANIEWAQPGQKLFEESNEPEPEKSNNDCQFFIRGGWTKCPASMTEDGCPDVHNNDARKEYLINRRYGAHRSRQHEQRQNLQQNYNQNKKTSGFSPNKFQLGGVNSKSRILSNVSVFS